MMKRFSSATGLLGFAAAIVAAIAGSMLWATVGIGIMIAGVIERGLREIACSIQEQKAPPPGSSEG